MKSPTDASSGAGNAAGRIGELRQDPVERRPSRLAAWALRGHIQRMSSRFRAAGVVAMAWVPYGALYVFAAARYGNRSLGEAIEIAAIPTVTAMLLGYAAWWLSAQHPWPNPMRARFYAAHLGYGLTLSMLWTLSAYVMDMIDTGQNLFTATFSSNTLGWQIILGLWMYGLVTGVSYAIRTRDQLQAQRQVAARAEALAARAQLDALRARLHPHFLYNALHSLSTLVRTDHEGAERAIERLGDLLRYSLDERPHRSATLGEEWDFTRDYLEIEKLRLSERLTVRADLSDEALACSVPAFTVQPLVENAIRHGIADRAAGGLLTVRAAVEDEDLVIVVTDDGPGAELSDLDSATGLGLRILRQRLAAEGGSLNVRTAPRDGFVVEVRFPQDETE